MATFPCSRCAQRYAGPQQTAYATVAHSSLRYSERLRLCPPCLADVVQNPAWSLVDETPALDADCGQHPGVYGAFALFCTYYEAHQDRADLYGRLCGRCLRSFLDAVFGPAQAAQAASAVDLDLEVIPT